MGEKTLQELDVYEDIMSTNGIDVVVYISRPLEGNCLGITLFSVEDIRWPSYFIHPTVFTAERRRNRGIKTALRFTAGVNVYPSPL